MEIKVEKQNVNYIFREFWFLVPSYQRPYVWGKDNVTDLLDDLWFAFENNPTEEYFLGSLVLQKTEQQEFKEYSILDGQQRLTSFLILMAVLRDSITDEKLKSVFHKRIYQEKSPGEQLPERNRMIYEIREDLSTFVENFIIQESGTTKSSEIINEIKNKSPSISHMATAIDVMREFFADESKISQLNNFGLYVSKCPVFICVSTNNRDDAFRLFTVLNARGVPLANSDILKSINIGEIADDKQKDIYAKKWEQIESDHNKDFDRFLSIIRTMLVKEKARANLLDEFEKIIYKKTAPLLGKGKATIDYLDKMNNHYQKIIELSTSGANLSNSYKNLITIMVSAISSDDWIAPLLAFYNKFGNTDLFEFLQKLEFKFSSDWILRETPTKRLGNMNGILENIEMATTAAEILSSTSLNEVNTDKLRIALNGEIYGEAFAKYILLKYECLLMTGSAFVSNYKSISIEHVLPQNPSSNSEWVAVFDNEALETWTHKLANLVLINGRKNSALSNYDFQDKKAKYLTGKMDIFPSSQIFSKYQKWDVEDLQLRQNEMLEKLVPLTI